MRHTITFNINTLIRTNKRHLHHLPPFIGAHNKQRPSSSSIPSLPPSPSIRQLHTSSFLFSSIRAFSSSTPSSSIPSSSDDKERSLNASHVISGTVPSVLPEHLMYQSPMKTEEEIEAAAAATNLLSGAIIIDPSGSVSGTLLWFHGPDEEPRRIRPLFELLAPKEMKVIAPVAAPISMSFIDDRMVRAWYDIGADRLKEGIDEDLSGIKEMTEKIHKVIDDEIEKCGRKSEKIIVGGFGQGAAMAMYAALTYKNAKLGGIISFSGYIPLVYSKDDFKNELSHWSSQIPILAIHGKNDNAIPFNYANKRYQYALTNYALKIQLRTEFHMGHFMSNEMLMNMHTWIQSTIRNS